MHEQQKLKELMERIIKQSEQTKLETTDDVIDELIRSLNKANVQ